MDRTFTREETAAIVAPVLPPGPCAFCGDTKEGAAHRIIDAIEDRLNAGEPPADVFSDYVPLQGADVG